MLCARDTSYAARSAILRRALPSALLCLPLASGPLYLNILLNILYNRHWGSRNPTAIRPYNSHPGLAGPAAHLYVCCVICVCRGSVRSYVLCTRDMCPARRAIPAILDLHPLRSQASALALCLPHPHSSSALRAPCLWACHVPRVRSNRRSRRPFRRRPFVQSRRAVLSGIEPGTLGTKAGASMTRPPVRSASGRAGRYFRE
jgi:hypothetical protein